MILCGLCIMAAENESGDLSIATIFIGFVFEAFAWAMWENCPDLRLSDDDESDSDRW